MDRGINPSAISDSSKRRHAEMACRISDEVCLVRHMAKRYSRTQIGVPEGDWRCRALRIHKWCSYRSRVNVAMIEGILFFHNTNSNASQKA